MAQASNRSSLSRNIPLAVSTGSLWPMTTSESIRHLQELGLSDVELTPHGYIMYVQEVKGDWMRVRLDVPSSYCASKKDPEPRSWEGWIRYLDDDGHPLVWFYARGC